MKNLIFVLFFLFSCPAGAQSIKCYFDGGGTETFVFDLQTSTATLFANGKLYPDVVFSTTIKNNNIILSNIEKDKTLGLESISGSYIEINSKTMKFRKFKFFVPFYDDDNNNHNRVFIGKCKMIK